MNIKGAIFDFNGTLFWDTQYQNDSWDEYLEQHNIVLSELEKEEYIHGRNGKDTFEYLLKKKLTDSEIHRLTEEKEILYRDECLRNGMELAPGAIPFINQLKKRNIKVGIATASGETNVNFFIQKFDLLSLFEKEHIIFNDGNIKGKPEPDIFLKAIEALDLLPEQVIVFEDSKSGVESAKRAGVQGIYIVNSKIQDNEFPRIRDFFEIPLGLFE